MFLAGALVVSLDTENAISINIKADLNLGQAPCCGQDTIEHKSSQGSVVGCHRPLSLEDVDFHTGLIISGRAENLALGGGDGGIAGNKGGGYGTKGFDSQGEGSDIKQQYILDISLEHSCLNSSPDSHYFIRVDPLVWFPIEELFYFFLNQGGPGLSADQNHLINLG